ncbi:MAG: hypothetical protein ACOVNK_07420 [Sphingorhabdus lacus]
MVNLADFPTENFDWGFVKLNDGGKLNLEQRIIPLRKFGKPVGTQTIGPNLSFSTIMNEWALRNSTPADRYVIDLILAHVPDGVSGSEGAYNRAAYLDRRRELLSMWADMLLDGFPASGKMLRWPSR